MNNKTETRPTLPQIAATFGVPVAALKRQFARNAIQLRECARRAAASPRGTYRGGTADYWNQQADTAHQKSL